jgi:hypothetical protein
MRHDSDFEESFEMLGATIVMWGSYELARADEFVRSAR